MPSWLGNEAEVGSVARVSKSRMSSQNISTSKSNAAVWRDLLHLSSKQEETLLLFWLGSLCLISLGLPLVSAGVNEEACTLSADTPKWL